MNDLRVRLSGVEVTFNNLTKTRKVAGVVYVLTDKVANDLVTLPDNGMLPVFLNQECAETVRQQLMHKYDGDEIQVKQVNLRQLIIDRHITKHVIVNPESANPQNDNTVFRAIFSD